MTDIVTSALPFWDKTRLWVLARPLSGFAETFSHYLMEVQSGGGSKRPDDDAKAEHVLFVTKGSISIDLDEQSNLLDTGGYAYIPAGVTWSLQNNKAQPATFHWIRKRYQIINGLPKPDFFITSDSLIKPTPMPNTNGQWATSHFVDPNDLRHDMHVNIVTFQPGASIPFSETHVMEHGIYILQGKGVYFLNGEWKEVEAGDYMWLRAFCPQACYAAGTEAFRYLLYKDVNRHMPLTLFGEKA